MNPLKMEKPRPKKARFLMDHAPCAGITRIRFYGLPRKGPLPGLSANSTPGGCRTL